MLVPAPLYAREGLPIFVKRGAILPSRPVKQFNSDEPDTAIRLEIYPADKGSYRLWEDAETFSTISYAASDDALHLSLENRTSLRRSYTVACRDDRSIISASTKGTARTVDRGMLTIEVAPSSTVQVEARLEAK